jgi:hypothetical protein
LYRDGISVLFGEDIVMKSSLSLAVPSAIAILSTTLLCGLSGAATSQTASDAATALPAIAVVAPKHVTRPPRAARPPQNPAQAATIAAHPAAPALQTPPPAQGSVLAKLAAIEKNSSNCTDGCQSSFKYGNQPWNGCSWANGFNLSATCRNVHNFKTYFECREYGLLLAWKDTEIYLYCSSLQAGGKYPGEKYVAAERSGRR